MEARLGLVTSKLLRHILDLFCFCCFLMFEQTFTHVWSIEKDRKGGKSFFFVLVFECSFFFLNKKTDDNILF